MAKKRQTPFRSDASLADGIGGSLERRGPRQRLGPKPLFGELAVAAGIVLPGAIAGALERHRKWGSSLGKVMVSTGVARAIDVARLYGAQRGVPFVNLLADPRDTTLRQSDQLDFYLQAQCLPWRRHGLEIIYVAADPDAARENIARHEGRPHPVFVTGPHDIHRTVISEMAATLDDRAVFGLSRRTPEHSAATQLSSGQKIAFRAMAIAGLLAIVLAPHATFVLLNIVLGVCFLLVAALRYTSIFIGLTAQPTPEELAYSHTGPPPDAELPVYTVMVPLYREARVLPIIARALRDLDYPASKLDIKLIFEESDRDTYEAAKALKLPDHFEFICVPDSLPRTKPKACNFALPFARGKFLVVYDAEDLPEPAQLKKAVAAFAAGDPALACVQAQLNYYNWNENWLTRQFAIEYASFFDLLLPTLVRLGIPIPLGGTSTHFRADLLRAAGAWDSHNVTEDADLGLRLALRGYRCGIIRSTTYEEANCQLNNWIKQRTRWIKGWLQTYFVRMRHPVRLYKALGLKGFIGFQVMIGGFTLSNIVHPLFYVAILAALTTTGMPADFENGAAFAFFNLLVLITGYSFAIAAGMAAVSTRGLLPLFSQTLMMPAYWLLISIPAYRALWQMAAKPFFWEKTDHGLSRMTDMQIALSQRPEGTQPERQNSPEMQVFARPH